LFYQNCAQGRLGTWEEANAEVVCTQALPAAPARASLIVCAAPPVFFFVLQDRSPRRFLKNDFFFPVELDKFVSRSMLAREQKTNRLFLFFVEFFSNKTHLFTVGGSTITYSASLLLLLRSLLH